jgi:hypothetical protein
MKMAGENGIGGMLKAYVKMKKWHHSAEMAWRSAVMQSVAGSI